MLEFNRHLGMLAVAITVVFVGASAAMAAPVGTVVGIGGTVDVKRNGARAPMALGQTVEAGDAIETAATGHIKLRMGDGSLIAIAPTTEMTIVDYRLAPSGQRLGASLLLKHGLVRTTVAEAPAAFSVRTATAVGTANSGDWFTEATNFDKTGVLHGSVMVTSTATGRSEKIPARWGAGVEADRDPIPTRPWSQSEFDAVIARTTVE